MRWLIRLVTPPSGTVLDPFAGSGTTLEAAILEGFDVVGVEREADYLPLIQARADRQGVTLAVVSTVAPDNVTPAEEATPAGGDFPCCAPNPVTEPVAEVDPLAQVKADIAAATTYEELLTIYNIATRVTGHHPADIVPLCAARKAELLAAA
jgi:hypothetical protein